MSFMAVAYVPAYLEDRSTFVKERANGLYGATPFIVSNFLIGLPYLCTHTNPIIAIYLLTHNSLNLTPLLDRRLLALKLPA
jgi:hypothetical protein